MASDYTLIKPPKKGGNYYYRSATDPKRTKHTTGQRTLAGARLFLQQLRDRAATDNQPTIPTFGEFAAPFFQPGCPYLIRCQQEGRPKNPKIVKDYLAYLRNYLLPRWEDVQLDSISPAAVREWRQGLLSGAIPVESLARLGKKAPTPRTVNYVVDCFRAILDQGEEDGIIPRSPLARVRSLPTTKDTPHDSLSQDELQVLFAQPRAICLQIWGGLEEYALFALLIGSGIRSGEARALRWGDIKSELSGVVIRRAIKATGLEGPPKNRKSRAIALPESIVHLLDEWRQASGNPGPDEYVFPGSEGGVRSKVSILRSFQRALRRANIHREGGLKLVAHSTRHTHATVLARAGRKELAVSQLGHSSPEMTERYTHLTETDLLYLQRQKGESQFVQTWRSVFTETESPFVRNIDETNKL